MTRVEEMTEAAYRYAPNSGAERQAFMAGVAHADAHPEPNLVDIDKVCEWLKGNTDIWVGFIGELKKAMKGEE